MTEQSPTSLGRAGLWVGAASACANLLGFAFLAVLSRAYSPASYGEISALLGVGAIGSVASVAVQLLIARQIASGVRRDDVLPAQAALGLGFGLLAVVVVLVPVLQPLLHITSAQSLLWLGLLLVPFTVGGAVLGLLLGVERFVAYAAGLILISGARVVAGLVALVRHTSVPSTMAVLTAATVAAVVVMAVVAGDAWWWRLPVTSRLTEQARAFLGILSGIGAFMVLSGLDLLLARHFLAASTSGIYSVGNLFTKAGLWGPQFVAIVVFPRLSAGAGRSLVLKAVAAVTALGVVGLALTVALGPRIVTAVAGASYADAGEHTWLFATLGILLALAHLLLLSSLADRSGWASWAIWVAVAAEAAVVATVGNGSLTAVLVSATAVTAVLVVVGLARALRAPVVQERATSLVRFDAA